jgi:hypothetical protein
VKKIEAKKERGVSYPLPVITTSTLKAVMPLILDDALKVSVAVAT